MGIGHFLVSSDLSLLLLGLNNKLGIHKLNGDFCIHTDKLGQDSVNIYNLGANHDRCWGHHYEMDSGKAIIFFPQSNSFSFYSEYINQYDPDNNEYYITSSKSYTLGKVDSKLVKKIWQTSYEPHSFYHTTKICFLLAKLNQLVALNNQTGEELWIYTLPKSFDFVDFTSKKLEGKIVKILGAYKDNVWLLISNGSLLALNTKTGLQSAHIVTPSFAEGFNSERQQNIKKHIDKNNYGVFNNSSNNVQLDTDKGVIFGFPYQCYAEVNLKNPTYPFTLWDIKHTLDAQKEGDKPGFESLKIGSWEKNDVYVYDSFFDSNRFGVFDRATREIRWSEYFEGEDEGWGAIQDLKYTSGYLYIHAKVDKSLHIYQLEKM